MIKIKFFFGEWTETTEERAREFALFCLRGMTGVRHEKRVEYFNSKYIQGAIAQKLLTEKELEPYL